MSNCRVCHRVLKNPKYVEIGIGPICLKKGLVSSSNDNNNDDYSLPFDSETMDIVCERTETGNRFNIGQSVVNHSPTGMEWGYGGSGPADFALNILLKFLPIEKAQEYHQDFKWKFVASLPREGGTIKGSDIKEWILSKGNQNVSYR